MTLGFLQNAFDHLRMQWQDWLAEAFPATAPCPTAVEIEGRDELLAQLEERRKSQAQGHASRQETIQALTKDLSEAQQRVALLQQRLTTLHQEDWLENRKVGSEIERAQTRLAEKAPLSLSMFIEELDSDLNRLRRMDPVILPSGADRDYIRMTKSIRFQTNSGSIKRRVVSLQMVRERALAMQTEPLTVKQIIDEVYRLRRSLPDIVDEETRGPLAAAILS